MSTKKEEIEKLINIGCFYIKRNMVENRIEAIKLRKANWSIPRISNYLKINRTTVGKWVKDYPVSKEIRAGFYSGLKGITRPKNIGEKISASLKKHYIRNPKRAVSEKQAKATARQCRIKRYQINKAWALNFLRGKCIKCNSIENLEFDHIYPKTKKFTLTDKFRGSKESFLEELKKCQLLCKKCHLKKTFTEGGANKNRAVGEQNGKSKLTEENVSIIKKQLSNGALQKAIAIKFNIHPSAISRIKNKKIWNHIK